MKLKLMVKFTSLLPHWLVKWYTMRYIAETAMLKYPLSDEMKISIEEIRAISVADMMILETPCKK